MNKYRKGKIYKINVNDEIYVGGTCKPLKSRAYHHNWCLRKGLNVKLYKKAREQGIVKFKLELLEDFPCESRRALNQQEEVWRTLLNATLNNNRCYIPKGYKRPRDNSLRNYKEEYLKRKPRAMQQIKCGLCDKMVCRTNIKRHQKTKKCKSHIRSDVRLNARRGKSSSKGGTTKCDLKNFKVKCECCYQRFILGDNDEPFCDACCVEGVLRDHPININPLPSRIEIPMDLLNVSEKIEMSLNDKKIISYNKMDIAILKTCIKKEKIIE